MNNRNHRRDRASWSRREFLSRMSRFALAGAAALPVTCRPVSESSDESPANGTVETAEDRSHPVVRIESLDGLDPRGRIDQQHATRIITESLDQLATESDLHGIRSSALFAPGERVGIKLNCLAGRGLSPQPPLIFALIDRLVAAGIKREEIVVFERTERELLEAGYTLEHRRGPRFLGNDSPGMGYDANPTLHRSIGSCFATILTREIDALINFGVLKDHNLAGLSAGMKNLFGLIHNPNKYHDDNCNPFVADVLGAPPIQAKLRLTLCDGMVAQYHGGPALKKRYTWNAGLFLASRDPVALDALGLEIIAKKRLEQGLPSLEEEGRFPHYIATAARSKLGEARLNKIPVIESHAR